MPRKKGNALEEENAHSEYRMEELTDPDIFPEMFKKGTIFFNATPISSIQYSVFMVKAV
jgi:hypothetical protein